VTSHGRVIFYDYDEICMVTDCVFRDLPQPSCEEEETSAEPWFHYGPRDVFPEQWLPFLSIPAALCGVFTQHHAELLTAAWWRSLSSRLSPH
jgi:isocitrate dehydrogenase kinase/phosphatase